MFNGQAPGRFGRRRRIRARRTLLEGITVSLIW